MDESILSRETLIQASYFVTAALFILGLKRMSSPVTARSGILWAGSGMLVATVVSFLYPGMTNYDLILAAIVVGGGLAWWSGKRVAMTIGVPKEIKDNEYRVGLVPSSVAELVHHGHSVLIERGAGGLLARGVQPLVANAEFADLLFVFARDEEGPVGLLLPPATAGALQRMLQPMFPTSPIRVRTFEAQISFVSDALDPVTRQRPT